MTMLLLVIPLLTFVIGLLTGILGIFGLALCVENKRRAEEYAPDPVADLSGLAVEILRRLDRLYFDVTAINQAAIWLHAHGYTPLSDPDEAACAFAKEC